MKRLYLIRHAKSSKDIPGIKDRERPLSQEGKREAYYIGKRLKKAGITAQAVYSSPAKRALDTARAIVKPIKFPLNKIKIKNILYRSNIPKMMKVVKSINDAAGSALIIGHNPEFLDFLNYLTPRATEKFPTCAVFGIDFDIDSWKRVSRKHGAIVSFDAP